MGDSYSYKTAFQYSLVCEDVRTFPDLYLVDDASGEYLLELNPVMREDGERTKFLFFTHGAVITFYKKLWSPEVSIQKFPSSLEPFREGIQARFLLAAQVHFDARKEKVSLSFVSDNVDFISIF
ncbi:hypothetical protein G8A07_12315 [Roseateles sp. DAIF2]|uniref:hypothetical protein n=1 Tax=Roseateles sp. DAIF2 TaxID=2714952 RepID=UPI0018A26A0C|nr:hypothetical protein [Roseateles sp. DAIF2]QPF73631.1 hypothetical protein G8A07_12315 [Roseateles sp. DAIF2]